MHSRTISQSITIAILAILSLKTYPQSKLTTQWDNDAFTFQKTGAIDGELSDDNYSNGLKVKYSQGDYDYYLCHEIYTPTILIVDFYVPSDRPYAGALYGGVTKSSFTHKQLFTQHSFTGGVVGPAAYGEEVQKSWHHFSKDVEPKGWDYQLHNEPILNYSYSQTLDPLRDNSNIKVFPSWQMDAGNMITDLSASLVLKFGKDVPSPNERFASDYWDFFIGATPQFVIHNIFLDGNSFQDSASVEKYPFVLRQCVGFEKIFTSCGFSFTYNTASQEFKDQVGDGHEYGGHDYGSFQFFKLF